MRARILVPNSMPLTLYLRLNACALLLLVCSSSISCLDNKSDDCPLLNTCGLFNYSYPFGEIGSGCGDPDFQVFCDDKSHPLLSISGDKYSILEPHLLGNISNDKNIKIVNDNFCDLSGNSASISSWPDDVFPIASGYTDLIFWRDCNRNFNNSYVSTLSLCGDDWSYSVDPDIDSEWRPLCKTYLEIPIKRSYLSPSSINEKLLSQGFEITWQVDPTKEQTCHVCLESKGSCGYNISAPATFLCHCPDDRTYADKCPGDGPPDSSIHKDTGGRNKPTIIGCSIGGAVLTAIALVLFLRFLVKRRKQPPPPRSSISKVEKFLREYAYEMPTRYSQSDLKKMTNNFAEKLGEGGYGVVYKGKLRNGILVAVKLLDRHRHTQTQFMNEVATIGRVHHVNLVRLSGYCFESFTSALVYEYMVNGSLEKFIFAGKEKGQVLRWEQLYSIALGTARGIAYLHQDCEKRIIHFDIKPHNILLDSEFTPKVSDFGLAKLCGKGDDHISMTGARGTPGYVAPEVWSTDLGPVTDKSDVYSYGMLLLEIVGGRKNIDVRVSRSSQFYFPEWAFKLLESGELGMRLRGGMETEDEEKTRRLTKVGLWCIQYKSTDRPCMSRVVQMLEGNGDDVTTPPLPFNCTADPENPLLSSVVTSSIEIRL